MTETNSTDQASGQSVMDRIASAFGVTDEQEAPQEPVQEATEEVEAEETPESDDVEVEYEGNRYRVPKPLEKAILQERDYTQKSQQIAEQRKVVEQTQQAMKLAQMEQEFSESAATEIQQLQQLDHYIQSVNSQNYANLTTDEKMDALLNIQQAERHREAVKASLESKRSKFQSELNAQVEKVKADVRELLSKQLPGFKPDSLKAIREYGKTVGFTEVALDGIELDARSASVLHKAMQFDALQANKSAAVQKLDAPVVKPGSSNPMPQAVKDKLAYSKALKSAKTPAERNAILTKRVEAMF